jgi:CRISPR-associated Csx2 family protein
MNRKVLLSFLGATEYKRCVYYFDINKSYPVVRFVQEAIAQEICTSWAETDVIYVFLTEEAQKQNWLGKIPAYNGIGLKHQFEMLKLPCQIKPILGFKEGLGEEQIWQNFKLIFECLQEKDEIWLDITNAFRSIPLFAAVLVHYAKFLKQIETKSVYYGAFEALGVPAYKVEEAIPDETKRLVPILNLSNILDLQAWTTAANDFLSHGNSAELKRLSVLKMPHSTLASDLDAFTNALATVRGKQIENGAIFQNVKIAIEALTPAEDTHPLNALLRKINEELDAFQTNDLENGIRAVEWCLKHHLIQQGITLLQEAIATMLCAVMRLPKDNYARGRKHIYNAFNCFLILEIDWKGVNAAKIRQIHAEPLFLQLEPAYNRLKKFRNDINHGGYLSDAEEYSAFEPILKTSLEEVKRLLNM